MARAYEKLAEHAEAAERKDTPAGDPPVASGDAAGAPDRR
jgi:hypothetical protein